MVIGEKNERMRQKDITITITIKCCNGKRTLKKKEKENFVKKSIYIRRKEMMERKNGE